MTIRTRIAPSPTGDPHVGTAYIALFNRVFAHSQGGQFILRIEDTDRMRNSRDSETMIFDSLKWLGLDWDEGPDVGGLYGPYRQSERSEIYQKYTAELLQAGHAFTCFCSPQRLNDVRKAQLARGDNPGYDGACLNLSSAAVSRRQAAGESFVVRMKIPQSGVCRFYDRLRGETEIPWSQVDMQVLMKSDGFPTYHLAVVVDDHLMKITHVLRGEEWISSMPKHVLLYDYFGWQIPEHCHLPLLRNSDRSKLSKRKNPTSVNYYRDMGYLPEALTNYLGRMGWSMPDEREIFSQQEMRQAFDIDRISLGGPVFDLKKLNWLNGQYIRHLTTEEFMAKAGQWGFNRDNFARIAPLLQQRSERWSDLIPQADYLLGDRRVLTAQDFNHTKLCVEDIQCILQYTLWRFEALRHWQKDALFDICNDLAGKLELKLRDFLFPLFLAISGRAVSLPLFESMEILGSDISRMRLRTALEALGGISKKQYKKLAKAYREKMGSG